MYKQKWVVIDGSETSNHALQETVCGLADLIVARNLGRCDLNDLRVGNAAEDILRAIPVPAQLFRCK